MRCQKHPEFDPYDESQFNQEKYRNCAVCCGLHYGAQPVGHYSGEYPASKHGIAHAKIKIGPMDLEKFGHIRFSLGFDFHQDDGPSWYVDEKSKIIYLDELSERRIKEFSKERKCLISRRSWTEPKMTSAISKSKKNKHTLIMTFGSSDTEVSLTLKPGMTVAEVFCALNQFTTKLLDIPKDAISETRVVKK